jgi:N6-L-threonylcarbamoyladenine synthase
MPKCVLLAIESSCDDTSAAILIDGEVVSNITANQKVHELYGGVVPELASRAHHANIIPVIEKALNDAKITKREINAIAVTKGPGLLGSLLVGIGFAKSFAQAMNIPIIEVNHMQAHVLAHFIDEPKPAFPFLCLTVSGGHTQIVLVKNYLDMEVIGETLDDAAGEAFDKAAKMMGIPYPGGPLVDKYAKEGNPLRFSFTEPQIADLNFSFSGLKTSILYFLQKETAKNSNFINENLNDLCASIQARIVSILLNKLKKASKLTGVNEIAIAGGVSANKGLRSELEKIGKELGWNTYIPQMQYCTDNAGMIAMAAYYKYLDNQFSDLKMAPMPRLQI